MNETNDILDKIGRRDGMTVPEGFFENFVARMSESLPEMPKSEFAPQPKRTMWHRLRPYTYMAAMFAGIWCMMKMFGMMSGAAPDLTDINNYPGVITALNDNNYVEDYLYPALNQYDILESLYEEGLEPADAMNADPHADAYSTDSLDIE